MVTSQNISYKISKKLQNYILSLNSKFLLENTSDLRYKLTPYTINLIENAIESKNFEGANALIYSYFPLIDEITSNANIVDSMGEELTETHPAPLIINFFKNRVILLASEACPNHCRFCFRRNRISSFNSKTKSEISLELVNSLEYIKNNLNIREVILSGGEPFFQSDSKIEFILEALKSFNHVKIIRIDTKIFTSLPNRITNTLVKILNANKPIFVIGQFLHSVELTHQTKHSISMLIDAGIPVMSHTPLLKNINANTDILEDLMFNLVSNRVIPHYVVHYIPTQNTEHFRISIPEGIEIVSKLLGRLSGIAIPKYILNLPEGGGKVPLSKSYIVKKLEGGYYFENFENRCIFYPEPI